MATYRRSRIALLVCALGVILMSATSTARYDPPPYIRDPDHQRIMDEMSSLINLENSRQNEAIAIIRERQNSNTDRIKTLEDRFWVIISGILGSVFASAIGALFSFSVHKRIQVMNDPREWDVQETRSRHRSAQHDPPENG